ncbi:MAG: heavy-metal-associated domain-containing protein [Candidatus Eremiobacteraeota bacterium]|nr:heavy-metal-associated domain-containing protein [Candidatus Eremiobacteraeota bacterium]
MSVEFSVPNMKCEGCVSIVKKELLGMGLKNVEINLETKRVEIQTNDVDIKKVKDVLIKAGFPPEQVN